MDQSRLNRITHECIKCGQIFETIAGSQNRNLFCSRRCYVHYGGRTWIEKIIAKSLRQIKRKYTEQKYIKGTKYATYVDFFIAPNICLYVDGDYWHSLPENKKRDKRNNKWLKQDGYIVMRISETQIKQGEKKYMPLLKNIKR